MRLRSNQAVTTLLRLAAWACIVVLAVLSLLPGKDLLRTELARLGHGKQVEHFIAWFGAATVIGLAYRARLSRLVLALALIPYAGLLEVGQLYAPDRGPSVLDFAASTGGILAAALLLPLIGRALAPAAAPPPDRRSG